MLYAGCGVTIVSSSNRGRKVAGLIPTAGWKRHHGIPFNKLSTGSKKNRLREEIWIGRMTKAPKVKLGIQQYRCCMLTNFQGSPVK